MSADRRLKVVLCWHMHQPYYFDPAGGYYRLPWTYLHAIKDYTDMAAHLEAVEGARAVVNFTPILLEQIDDYARRIADHLERGAPLPDPLLDALVAERLPREAERRRELIGAALRVNRATVIERFPAYRRLADLAQRWIDEEELLHYLDDRFIFDLLTWYHIGWLGESVRREEPLIGRWMEQGGDFDHTQRRELLALIGRLLEGVVPRYRALAEAGRVELSFTPYGHPIAPLLLDLESAREALPDAPLPEGPYPGGEARVRWHVRHGIEVFERCFGHRPRGCWPAEGAVSDATLRLLEEEGIEWSASGGQVLRNSLDRAGADGITCIHRPYRLGDGAMRLFFRDDGLSDLIGFSYAKWSPEEAVADLVHHLENIATACAGEEGAVVPIILDGENAWEYYPENGYPFLRLLYQRLAEHPTLELTTFEKCLDGARELPSVVAGSWVYGTFSTWIGEAEKNHGWALLIEAKRRYDRRIERFDARRRAELEHQLAVCEGSDWFWWFGDYNPADAVSDFDRLYRAQLVALYRLLEEPAPEALRHPISTGGGDAATAGTMRRAQEDS